ncbi:tetratricopeptide repeat protein [Azospirillum doebereinerae]
MASAFARVTAFVRTAAAALALLLAVALAAGPAMAQDPGPANRLFVQAMQLLRQADNTYDVAEESRLLKDADKLFNEIVTKYPDSPLAVQLVTNQFVGDFDFYEFRSRIRAMVCNEPLGSLCFLHRIGEMLPPVETPIAAARWDWLSLAVAYQQIGDTGRAKEIVAPFVSAVRRGGINDSAGQDLFVGRALALMGQTQLALDITRQIADCSTRIYNLADIAKAAAWRGDNGLATALADEAKAYATARGCSWELGLVSQALLRAGKEAQARTLFLNTVETQFSKFKETKGDCCPPELAVAAADMGDANLALNLLRTVQDENPWTIPAVLGRLARRGETVAALSYAEQVPDIDTRGEAFAELVEAAQKRGDPAGANDTLRRLNKLVDEAAGRRPGLLAQKAKAEKVFYNDDRWRRSFQLAINAAEKSSNFVRRDIGAPLLAALVRIETGLPMLD